MNILYRDQWFAAVDKPPGIGIHNSRLIRDDITLIGLLEDQLDMPVFNLHRLDRPVSGVLLCALDRETAKDMSGNYWRESVSKSYVALVRGYPPQSGTIERPLKKRRWKKHPPHGETGEPGYYEARTGFEVIASAEIGVPNERYETTRFSFVRLRPATGRYHQLRRHLAGIGYPIIGDTTHGDTKINTLVNNRYGHTRLMLHCREISFIHPRTAENCVIGSGVCADMETILSDLGIINGNRKI